MQHLVPASSPLFPLQIYPCLLPAAASEIDVQAPMGNSDGKTNVMIPLEEQGAINNIVSTSRDRGMHRHERMEKIGFTFRSLPIFLSNFLGAPRPTSLAPVRSVEVNDFALSMVTYCFEERK